MFWRESHRGHVQRRDCEYTGRTFMRLEMPNRRPRGRPKRRFMDVVKEDMKLARMREEMQRGELDGGG